MGKKKKERLQRNADIPFCLASPTLQLPNDYFQWADAIFDCGVLGYPKRFEIEDITGEVK